MRGLPLGKSFFPPQEISPPLEVGRGKISPHAVGTRSDFHPFISGIPSFNVIKHPGLRGSPRVFINRGPLKKVNFALLGRKKNPLAAFPFGIR